MIPSYGRDLDLNLLRVFVAVASAGSVTGAAQQLYLTQPAVSAALRRLTSAVGAPLFARSGRGVVLTQRGQRLYDVAKPQLVALIRATLAPPSFDPQTSDQIVRVGLSDAMEGWLLPKLLRALDTHAPRLRLINQPIQFRTIADALSSRRVDVAVTVADELPAGVQRQTLVHAGYACLYDPRELKLKQLTQRDYFAHDHVIVSYNGDLRGIVEDLFQKQRRVRCTVSSFSHVGSILEGSNMLATIPTIVAEHILALHPKLKAIAAPFKLSGAPIELLWPAATQDDDACKLVRQQLSAIFEAYKPALKLKPATDRARA